jgi:hypothetical protein
VKRLLALAAAVLLLAGCGGGPDNTDPRKGRVVTAEDNCLWGDCFRDWKACVGPDLLISLYGEDSVIVKDSPECKP